MDTQIADENPGISEYNAQYINRHLYSGLLIPTNLFKQVDDEDICVSGLIVDNTTKEYNILLHVILHVWNCPTLQTCKVYVSILKQFLLVFRL